MKKYDIYICCAKEEKETAQKLSNGISTYKLPKGVSFDENLDYRRIYIDCEEKPLNQEIADILSDSQYLMILCSPEAKQSVSLNEKLNYFQKRWKENVIAVIVRGEPIDSFPESFIEKKLVQRIMPDKSIVERVETIEPVASDLRADNDKEAKRRFDYEKVRIVASVLGVHPDVLEMRHKKRYQKRLYTIVAVAALIGISLSVLFITLGLKAKNEGDIAKKQNDMSAQIIERTFNELPEDFKDNEDALAVVEELIEEIKEGMSYE